MIISSGAYAIHRYRACSLVFFIDIDGKLCRIREEAEVAELADALRSGRSDLDGRVGSTPTFGILILIDATRAIIPSNVVFVLGCCCLPFPRLHRAVRATCRDNMIAIRHSRLSREIASDCI